MALIRTNGSTATASIIKIGSFNYNDTAPTLTVTSLIPNYQSVAASDFFIAKPSGRGSAGESGSNTTTPSIAYNATTGVVTINGTVARGGCDAMCWGTLYYVKGGLPS